MAALLVDPSPASPDGQLPADAVAGAPSPPASGSAPLLATAVHSCGKCGAPMAVGQDWCLQCGAGAGGSIGTPSWRSAVTILGATAVLVLGAAGAGYAALSKRTKTQAPAAAASARTTATLAVTPPPATTPATPTPGAALGTPTTIKPLGTIKPPKIPLTAVVPKTTSTTPAATTPTTTTPTAPATTGGASASEESKPAAILLDTDAASTYNPYSYPASIFGDPSLTIDGDTSTAWTAQVNPATAPSMAVGVLISLKAEQKVAELELVTSTPGMSVQVYGATGQTVPASITDPAWTPLSSYLVVRKKHVLLHLRHATKAFTFVTLWISKAPASSVGTAEAPGHVSVNEIELFPPS